MRRRVFVLSFSLIIVLCSSFSVFGASMSTVMQEPSTSDTQGYLMVCNEDFTKKNLFFWSIQPYSASDTDNNVSIPSMSLILNDDSVTFTALHTGSARVTLTRVYNGSTQYLCMSRQFTTSTSYTQDFSSGVYYYCYSGNIGVVDDNVSSSNNYLNVTWGSNGIYNQEFDEVINELVTIDTHLLNISNSVDGLEGDLDAINTTLTKIRDYVDTLETTLNTISGDISTIKTTLNTVNSRLSTALTRLNTIISNQETMIDNQEIMINELQLIREAVTYSLEDVQNAPYADNRPFYEFEGSEERLLNDDGLTDIAELELEFGNSFDVVWELISQAWQSNAKVFTVVIMCLTIGVIKLVLNR